MDRFETIFDHLYVQNYQNPIGFELQIENSWSNHKDVTGGGWDLLNTKVLNSGEAFCAFTLLYFYWIEADTNPGLESLTKKKWARMIEGGG